MGDLCAVGRLRSAGWDWMGRSSHPKNHRDVISWAMHSAVPVICMYHNLPPHCTMAWVMLKPSLSKTAGPSSCRA